MTVKKKFRFLKGKNFVDDNRAWVLTFKRGTRFIERGS